MARPGGDQIAQRLAVGRIERPAGRVGEGRADVHHPRGARQHPGRAHAGTGQDQRRAALAGVEAAVLAEMPAALGPVVPRGVDDMQIRAAARVGERGGQPAGRVGIAVALVGRALLAAQPTVASRGRRASGSGSRSASGPRPPRTPRPAGHAGAGDAGGIGDHHVLALTPGHQVDDLGERRAQQHVEGGPARIASSRARAGERDPGRRVAIRTGHAITLPSSAPAPGHHWLKWWPGAGTCCPPDGSGKLRPSQSGLRSSPRGGPGRPLGPCGPAGRPALQPGSGNQALVICLRLGSRVEIARRPYGPAQGRSLALSFENWTLRTGLVRPPLCEGDPWDACALRRLRGRPAGRPKRRRARAGRSRRTGTRGASGQSEHTALAVST